jgi:hypothetical protein
MKASTTRSMLSRYSLDSSFFIDLWHSEGRFSRDVFVGIWEALNEGISGGHVVAPEAVREELADTNDPALKRWLSERSRIFIPIDQGQLDALTEVVRRYPAYADQPRNLADPAVIALAMADSLTVLTSEILVTQQSLRNPKIPNVCGQFGVECFDVMGYCRAEKIELQRSSDAEAAAAGLVEHGRN